MLPAGRVRLQTRWAGAMARRMDAPYHVATLTRTTTLLLALLLCSAVAFAHHGWSGYDESKPLTLAGTVTERG